VEFYGPGTFFINIIRSPGWAGSVPRIPGRHEVSLHRRARFPTRKRARAAAPAVRASVNRACMTILDIVTPRRPSGRRIANASRIEVRAFIRKDTLVEVASEGDGTDGIDGTDGRPRHRRTPTAPTDAHGTDGTTDAHEHAPSALNGRTVGRPVKEPVKEAPHPHSLVD
jgi:hypothetical protein